jgi:hypothetical protein
VLSAIHIARNGGPSRPEWPLNPYEVSHRVMTARRQ